MPDSPSNPHHETLQEAARALVERLGGTRVVADLLGVRRATVYRWFYPRERGGTGGLISPETQLRLLEHSARNRLGITPADFWAGVVDARGRLIADVTQKSAA